MQSMIRGTHVVLLSFVRPGSRLGVLQMTAVHKQHRCATSGVDGVAPTERAASSRSPATKPPQVVRTSSVIGPN